MEKSARQSVVLALRDDTTPALLVGSRHIVDKECYREDKGFISVL